MIKLQVSGALAVTAMYLYSLFRVYPKLASFIRIIDGSFAPSAASDFKVMLGSLYFVVVPGLLILQWSAVACIFKLRKNKS